MADKRRKRATASLHILQPDATGADIGAEAIFVAVPPELFRLPEANAN
jgi:hypothetical protein